MAYPLVRIQKVYERPPEIKASVKCKDYAELLRAMIDLEFLRVAVYDKLGYDIKVPGIALNSVYAKRDAEKYKGMINPRDRLKIEMKNDPNWKDLYMAVVKLSDGEPIEPYENLSDVPYLPDWNELTSVVRDIEFEDGVIRADLGIAHCFTTQLRRQKKMKESFEPLSVYGRVMTRDGVVMGKRLGNYPGYMTVPAGSLKIEDDDGRPYADFVKGVSEELIQELGLTTEDARAEGVCGVFLDPTLRGFVFEVSTQMSFDNIKRKWNTSVDRKEHEYLFNTHTAGMPYLIQTQVDRRPEIETQIDPKHLLLPSGAAVLLLGMPEHDFETTVASLGGLFSTEKNYRNRR